MAHLTPSHTLLRSNHTQVINPFKPSDAKQLDFKVFRATVV